jgi:hypothetical protein
MLSLPFENESGNLQLCAAGGADGIADWPSVQVVYPGFTQLCDETATAIRKLLKKWLKN